MITLSDGHSDIMTVIVIVILMLVWILCILLAALIGLGLAAWVLSENYDALSDACADQASVWAWTAIALPTFAAGLTMLMLMKYTGCKTPSSVLSCLYLERDLSSAVTWPLSHGMLVCRAGFINSQKRMHKPRARTHTSARAHTRTHTHMHARTHTRMHTHACTHTHARTHAHTQHIHAGMDRIGCTKGTPQLIIPVVLLQGSLIALSIFGVCAWVFEGAECGAHFYHDYTSLYVLFRIVVILGCVIGLYLLIEMVVLFTIFMLIALGYTDQDSDFLRHNRNYGNSHHWYPAVFLRLYPVPSAPVTMSNRRRCERACSMR